MSKKFRDKFETVITDGCKLRFDNGSVYSCSLDGFKLYLTPVEGTECTLKLDADFVCVDRWFTSAVVEV